MLSVQLENAGARLSEIHDAASAGDAVLIEEAARPSVAVVSVEYLDQLLASRYQFTSQVEADEYGFSIWLEELPVHAQGKDFESASRRLVDALISYVRLWEAELSHSPNHFENRGWVWRVQLSGEDPDRILRLLFEG